MKKLLLVGILHGLLCPLAVMAQTVTVTFNGTADDATNGFAINDSVEFVIVINDSAPAGPIVADAFNWAETISSAPLFTAISGSGITGTYIKPSNLDWFNYQSEIELYEPNGIYIHPFYAGGADMGIDLNGNNAAAMTFSATLSGLDYGNIGGDAPAISPYLSNYAGTYATTWSDGYIQTSAALTNFTFTSVTIATTAVPEPSTYAALVGLLALGFVGVRRRRRG
ncbi:MAG: PEP-CTERM sorting domain-containing protein [Cephaloticoccus sp.]|nr:PEP-CTERM sorting domain-containing protein [Cephaloticoccus sp.]MCF7759563.1 PEP-CTERM sorting domain-containing protein [Cephaloticoccus sp.]